MDLKLLTKCESYFAAANGYHGFISFFDEFFSPEKLERLFILKGGPGTGKSSLMKKIVTTVHDQIDKVELIYCASDKNSLDGIVIERNNKKYAVIDGTAPHCTDPRLPGAADEIINLGLSWDEKMIRSHRDEIENLNNEKSCAYECAYKYLGICGKIADSLSDTILEYGFSNINPLIESVDNLTLKGEQKIRILTSFGKGGFFKLDTLNKKAKTKINVVGVYGSEYTIMNELSKMLTLRGISHVKCPSALNSKNTYALYVNESDTLYICGELEDTLTDLTVDSSRVIQKALSKNKSRLEFLARERESFLWAASDEFQKASNAHFGLEKIYSAAMDFRKNDKIAEEISKLVLA